MVWNLVDWSARGRIAAFGQIIFIEVLASKVANVNAFADACTAVVRKHRGSDGVCEAG